MLPGLGLFRRVETRVLCGAAFRAGLRLGPARQADACLAAGGARDWRGFCSGARP
jgi:hypothetical protein